MIFTKHARILESEFLDQMAELKATLNLDKILLNFLQSLTLPIEL